MTCSSCVALHGLAESSDTPADAEVERALRAIEEHPTRQWTVDSLAAHVGLSRAALARRFTLRMGDPPLTYLTRWRLALAADLLVGSDRTLATIASRVGYANRFALSAAFKRVHGESPRDYRRHHTASDRLIGSASSRSSTQGSFTGSNPLSDTTMVDARAWKRGLGAWIVSPIRGVLRGMNELLDTVRGPVLLAATVATGLQAGTYYTWACGVMPGLARAHDRTLVATMQSVNTAIVNPVFMLTFIGAPLLAGVAAATSGQTARPWVVAGLTLAVSTVVITGVGNIPTQQRARRRRPGRPDRRSDNRPRRLRVRLGQVEPRPGALSPPPPRSHALPGLRSGPERPRSRLNKRQASPYTIARIAGRRPGRTPREPYFKRCLVWSEGSGTTAVISRACRLCAAPAPSRPCLQRVGACSWPARNARKH